MVFNSLMVCPFILLGTFGPLVTMTGNKSLDQPKSSFIHLFKHAYPTVGIASLSFLFLTVFGLLVIRVTQPHLNRPYKPWLIAPVVFCICTASIVLRGVISSPIQGAILALLIGLGAFVHYWKVRTA